MSIADVLREELKTSILSKVQNEGLFIKADPAQRKSRSAASVETRYILNEEANQHLQDARSGKLRSESRWHGCYGLDLQDAEIEAVTLWDVEADATEAVPHEVLRVEYAGCSCGRYSSPVQLNQSRSDAVADLLFPANFTL